MKALILSPFHPEYLERLRGKIEVIQESWMDTRRLLSPEEMIERIQGEDIPILLIEADFVFDEVFEGAEKLRFLGICRAAVNHVDIDAATEHGVLVVNTPARNAISVAELTIGLMLSLARQIPAAHSMIQSQRWTDPVEPYISLRGVELAGKTVGIVGLGAVGFEVAKRLRAFDMPLLVYDPFVKPERLTELEARQVDLKELMKKSDFVTIHCTASPETAGLIGPEEIESMRPAAYLINTAGWEIVDEISLMNALEKRLIAGAAFDIYQSHPVPLNSPLFKLNNVVLTPHIGGSTDGTLERYSRILTEEIERFLEGKRPRNLVNPQAWRGNAG